VVSRSIVKEMAATGGNCAYLDMTKLSPELVGRRFPNIRDICADFGLDILRDPIPVRPSAHYAMGGVRTDLDGRTSIRRLLAAGECASTGVHGANRLASNSLLEGLVFGEAAGRSARPEAGGKFPARATSSGAAERRVQIDVGDLLRSLKSLMWRTAGVFRTGGDLELAVRQLAFWREYAYREEFTAPAGLELQNMLAVAAAVARSALARTESRGAHQRLDFPATDDAGWRRHTLVNKGDVYR
jgi:L-aspartate oxidase